MRGAFGADLQVLANRDEGGHRRILRSERPRDDRAEMGHRHRLRRDVAGVPVILVPRVKDEAQVRGGERADHRAAIDDLANPLETLSELDLIDGRVDGRKRAEDPLDRHARRERRVRLGIERLGLRHAAGHPEEDHGVGGRLGCGRGTKARLAAFHERRERGRRGRAHKLASREAGRNELFLGDHDDPQ